MAGAFVAVPLAGALVATVCLAGAFFFAVAFFASASVATFLAGALAVFYAGAGTAPRVTALGFFVAIASPLTSMATRAAACGAVRIGSGSCCFNSPRPHG